MPPILSPSLARSKDDNHTSIDRWLEAKTTTHINRSLARSKDDNTHINREHVHSRHKSRYTKNNFNSIDALECSRKRRSIFNFQNYLLPPLSAPSVLTRHGKMEASHRFALWFYDKNAHNSNLSADRFSAQVIHPPWGLDHGFFCYKPM